VGVVAEEEEGTPPRVDHRLALRRSREVVGVSEEGDAEEERGGGAGGGVVLEAVEAAAAMSKALVAESPSSPVGSSISLRSETNGI